MAFFKRKGIKPVEDFICSMDSAIDTEKTDMEAYRETWDQSKLVFIEGQQPTIFKVRIELPRKHSTEVKNASVGLDKKGRAKFALGDHEYELVRTCLTGIENPAGADPSEVVQWRKSGDGVTSEDVMDILSQSGVVEEIYAFYHHCKKNRDEDIKKK